MEAMKLLSPESFREVREKVMRRKEHREDSYRNKIKNEAIRNLYKDIVFEQNRGKLELTIYSRRVNCMFYEVFYPVRSMIESSGEWKISFKPCHGEVECYYLKLEEKKRGRR